MTTSEERIKILKMIQEGKISAEDGIALLEVLAASGGGGSGTPGKSGRAATTPQAGGTGSGVGAAAGGRTFRVRVTDTRTGKTRVNVRMPVGMVSAGMKLGARFAPQVEGLDAGSLMEMLNSGVVGKIVDVYDEDDSEHVEVFIE